MNHVCAACGCTTTSFEQNGIDIAYKDILGEDHLLWVCNKHRYMANDQYLEENAMIFCQDGKWTILYNNQYEDSITG